MTKKISQSDTHVISVKKDIPQNVDSRENAKWLEVFEVAQKQLRDIVPNVIMKYVIAVKDIHSFWRYRKPLCSLQLDS